MLAKVKPVCFATAGANETAKPGFGGHTIGASAGACSIMATGILKLNSVIFPACISYEVQILAPYNGLHVSLAAFFTPARAPPVKVKIVTIPNSKHHSLRTIRFIYSSLPVRT